uniref:Uncharacterized protein n=1 Tax=Glossina palpalis gambiensis TaxID=67801 RepID=A0A1B0BE85_9MUSC
MLAVIAKIFALVVSSSLSSLLLHSQTLLLKLTNCSIVSILISLNICGYAVNFHLFVYFWRHSPLETVTVVVVNICYDYTHPTIKNQACGSLSEYITGYRMLYICIRNKVFAKEFTLDFNVNDYQNTNPKSSRLGWAQEFIAGYHSHFECSFLFLQIK